MFRFTIRDVLWLTALVAVALVGRFEVVRVRNHEHTMEAQIKLLKGALEKAGYDVQLTKNGASVDRRHSGESP